MLSCFTSKFNTLQIQSIGRFMTGLLASTYVPIHVHARVRVCACTCTRNRNLCQACVYICFVVCVTGTTHSLTIHILLCTIRDKKCAVTCTYRFNVNQVDDRLESRNAGGGHTLTAVNLIQGCGEPLVRSSASELTPKSVPGSDFGKIQDCWHGLPQHNSHSFRPDGLPF